MPTPWPVLAACVRSPIATSARRRARCPRQRAAPAATPPRGDAEVEHDQQHDQRAGRHLCGFRCRSACSSRAQHASPSSTSEAPPPRRNPDRRAGAPPPMQQQRRREAGRSRGGEAIGDEGDRRAFATGGQRIGGVGGEIHARAAFARQHRARACNASRINDGDGAIRPPWCRLPASTRSSVSAVPTPTTSAGPPRSCAASSARKRSTPSFDGSA